MTLINKGVQGFYRVLMSCLFVLVLHEPIHAQISKTDSLIGLLKNATADSTKIKLNYWIGYHFQLVGNIEKALQYHRTGLDISAANNDLVKEGTGCYWIGEDYIRRDIFDSSLKYSKLALEFYDAAGKKPIYYTYAASNIAAYYLDRGDNANALKWVQRELEVAEERKDTSAIANSYNFFCAIYQSLNDRAKSIEWSEKALALKRQTHTYFNLDLFLTNLADMYIEDKRYADALPLLREAVYVSREKFPSADGEGTAYMSMGNCYNLMEQYDSALHYLGESKRLLEQIGDTNLMANMEDCFATAYLGLKDYAHAMMSVDHGIGMARSRGIKLVQRNLLNTKARIYYDMGEYKKAIDVYDAFHQLSDTLAGEAAQAKMAELQKKYELDRKDKEINFLDSTNKLNNQRISQQQQLYMLLHNESVLKDQKLRNEILLKQALESENELVQKELEKESALKDALDGENKLKQKELLAQQQLNSSLEKENVLKQKNLVAERKISAGLIGGVALLLLASTLLLLQYRRQRAANATISHQSDKLTLLMKELHHRVKNNLQIVSSLLSMQSFRMHDKAAATAVREGQHRIEAMSLIHQRLYTKDDITRVNIKEFITDVAESLMSAYGYRPDKFDMRFSIDDEMMDVDKAIPLSLIINEIITNAFKYAYSEVERPELNIDLRRHNKNLVLTIKDNGKGLNEAEWKKHGGSFGKELIHTFVKQLHGNLAVSVDKGTRFTLTIPYTEELAA